MTTYWTNTAICLNRVRGAGWTSSTCPEFETFISEAEGYFTMLMKSNGYFGINGGSFDATKHAILRRAATAYAVLCVVTSAAASFQTPEEMFAIADLCYMEFNQAISELTQKDIVDYLKNV